MTERLGRASTAFMEVNRRGCEALAGFLPHTRVNIFRRYQDSVARAIELQPSQLVVDVGAGHTCPYAASVRPSFRPHIVGIDLSLDRMEGNSGLDEKRVADVVVQGLPFAVGEVDIVTSRSVLEHLSNVDRFIAESARVLKPGGYSIHLLSGGRSHVALINRLLPESISNDVLFSLHPSSRSVGGHPVVYDRCHHTALRRMFATHCFEVTEIDAHFGSDYFYFLLPLFLLESVFLVGLQFLRVRDLAVSYLVVARRI